MIPEFEVTGTLPPGIYLVSLQEFEEKFVYNYKRKTIYEGLTRLIADLRSIGCPAIYIDGSFVTNKQLPKDVDVCWELIPGDDFLGLAKRQFPVLFMFGSPRVQQQKIYCADVFPANMSADASGMTFLKFFQQVRYTRLPKGIIKIEI